LSAVARRAKAEAYSADLSCRSAQYAWLLPPYGPATDDAMHWVFGDCGAYYVFIDTDRLAANDFSKLEFDFENY
jgi:uncharacterized protein YwqG